MEACSSDFPSLPPRVLWTHYFGVGGALISTLALGFTEACLQLERRPIPLRFALRYAVANLVPSIVWTSVPVHHVATASGLPFSALIHDTALASSRSVAVGKRLVLVTSVRALRLIAGSYGLAWGLWHWHGAASSDTDYGEGMQYRESVVRLAPPTSPLSRTSRQKHGDHILSVSIDNYLKSGSICSFDVDWKNVGIQGRDNRDIKVIEVEFREGETAANAMELKAGAIKEGASVCTVAVLPLCGSPVSPSVVDSFNVCFNPLSAVQTFIASVCHEREVTHVILASSQREQVESIAPDALNGNSFERYLSTSQLARGLLLRHGITSNVWALPEWETGHGEGKGIADQPKSSNKELVFFISQRYTSKYAAAMMREMKLESDNACFIVEESLFGQKIPKTEVQAQSELLQLSTMDKSRQQGPFGMHDGKQLGLTIFSVADISDQTLQGVRNLLRQGKTPDAIQRDVYQAFGPQRVVAPLRLDQFTNLNV